MLKKFIISTNCFFPKPKDISQLFILNQKKYEYKIKNIKILEKITNLLFSNKEK